MGATVIGVKPNPTSVTVIGGKVKVNKPTSIGGGQQEIKPVSSIPGTKATTVTSIGGGKPPEPPKVSKVSSIPSKEPEKEEPYLEKVRDVLKPTRIMVETESDVKFTKETPKVSSASSIKGTKVERLEDIIERLKGEYDTTPEILQKIAELTRFYDLSDLQCYGIFLASVQHDYKEVVDTFLATSEDSSSQTASRNMSRILTILGDIKDSMDKQSFWKRKDPWEVYSEYSVEIHQLVNIMDSQSRQVKQLISRLKEISATYSNLAVSLEAMLMIIGKHSQKSKLEKIEMNFQELLSSINLGMVTRNSFISNLEVLLDKISNMVLIRIPSWMEQVALFRATKTETDKYQFRESLGDLISTLKR